MAVNVLILILTRLTTQSLHYPQISRVTTIKITAAFIQFVPTMDVSS